ncbi:hypothetical protein FCV25MIE_33694 [Fagus crenata]
MVPILTNYHTPKNDLNLLTVGGHNVDVLVTCTGVVAILFMELVQYFFLSFSDWDKVQLLCWYVKKPSWQNNKCLEKIIQIVCHRKWLKPWGRNLGQYSLLESYNYNPSRLLYNRCITSFVNKPRNGQTESNRIKLPLEVKKAIIVSLRTLNGQRLKNGEASLQQNGEALLQQNQIWDELSWACRLETQTHVIMVWHIATSLCEKECKQDNIVMKSTPFIVANALSKYCAYLVAFAPRFLPDNSYMTEVIFDQVVQEARDVLNGCNSTTSKYGKMMKISAGVGKGDPGENIIKRGARWEILADFWAEMMLFVTPSNDTTVHAEYLAKGGEFVTHLWALLSHAGILERDSAHEDVSALVRNGLTERAKNFNIVLDDVAITHLSYGAEFSRAVEQKQVAQQEEERSKFVVAKVEQERRAAIIRAEGESESTKLISEATAQTGMGLIELRKIEAMRENAATLAKSPNVSYLPGDKNILLAVNPWR